MSHPNDLKPMSFEALLYIAFFNFFSQDKVLLSAVESIRYSQGTLYLNLFEGKEQVFFNKIAAFGRFCLLFEIEKLYYKDQFITVAYFPMCHPLLVKNLEGNRDKALRLTQVGRAKQSTAG